MIDGQRFLLHPAVEVMVFLCAVGGERPRWDA